MRRPSICGAEKILMVSAISTYFAVVAGLAFAAFAFASYIFSRRRRKIYESMTNAKTYHCLRCDSVYISSDSDESAPCPNCGYKNGRLKF